MVQALVLIPPGLLLAALVLAGRRRGAAVPAASPSARPERPVVAPAVEDEIEREPFAYDNGLAVGERP